MRDRNVSHGLSSMAFEEPFTRALGMAAAALGRHEEAWPLFEEARARAESMGAITHVAHIEVDHAVARLSRGEPTDRDVAARSLASARAIATTVGMAGLLVRIDALEEAAPGAHARPVGPARPGVPEAALALRQDGETWVIDGGDRAIRMRDSKGMRLLARLVAEPGRELHVLDLEHGERAEGIDREIGRAHV